MRGLRLIAVALLAVACSGCAVVAVTGAAVTVGAAVVGTAVDVGVGAVRLTGKAVGAAVDALTGDDEPIPPAAVPKPSK